MELRELAESCSEAQDYKGHTIWVRAERADASAAWTIHMDIQSLTTGAWYPAIRDDGHSYGDLGAAYEQGGCLGRQFIDHSVYRTQG